MYRSQKTAFFLGVLAALLWSANAHQLDVLRQADVPLLVAEFHFVFWGAAGLLLFMFLGGRLGDLSAFHRRETTFIVLAALGGYGFWLCQALSLDAGGDAPAALLFYTAPLLMAALSLLTRERAEGRAIFALLLGYVGCIMIVQGGRGGAAGGAVLPGLGAAACWAAFTVLARPVASQERVLPVAALVALIGAVCLFVTCLSHGLSIFDMGFSQFWMAALTGFFTVGCMMAVWLKCVALVPAAVAAPFWYLGLVFGLFWAWRAGQPVDGWWALGGTVLVALGLQAASGGTRGRRIADFSDVIRG